MKTQVFLSESYEGVYERRNHSVGISMWHLEWCTKYRYKMFQQPTLRTFCEVVIKEGCKRYSIGILALNVQPDHIHLVANLPRGMTDERALQLLKGFSSFLLFRLVPEFRLRYPKGHLWSCGSFAATVGYTELEGVIKYVENQ